MNIHVLVFMSEIKYDLKLHLPTRRLSRQKTFFFFFFFFFFASRVALMWSCSACLGRITLGKKSVLYLENGAK